MKNIILISSDTFRYDNLAGQADMQVRTPSLDAFARRAASLSRYYTSSFPTIPERTDLISGRFGWPWHGWQDLALSTRNALPRLLGAHGYVTQLICDCPHLFNSGFQKTFDAACALRGQENDIYMLRMNHAIEEVMPPEKTRSGRHFQGHTLVDLHRWTNRDWRGEEDRFPPRTAKLAVEWLEENCDFSPFLLWVDFFDPHEPWDPPEYMVRKYDPDYTGTPMLHPNYGRASDYTPAELRNLRAHYCAEAELVDRWVGRIFQKIDDLDLWDNSIVIFTTDHGMSLGEHDRTGKTNINTGDDRFWPTYPEIAHIPLMVAAPGVKAGHIVQGFAQPVDVMPTLADLAGLRLESPEPLHGVSFADQLCGSNEPIRGEAITAEFLRPEAGKLRRGATTPVLHADQWAYVPIGPTGQPELYDIVADPGARHDVIADHRGVARQLHERLAAWLKEIDAPAPVIELFDRSR
ncbi:MAG: sulfatase [bacterium]|nr:sulfatase [bacterium]